MMMMMMVMVMMMIALREKQMDDQGANGLK